MSDPLTDSHLILVHADRQIKMRSSLIPCNKAFVLLFLHFSIGLSSAGPFLPNQTPIADATAFILSILEETQKFVCIGTPTAFKEGDDRGLFWNLGVSLFRKKSLWHKSQVIFCLPIFCLLHFSPLSLQVGFIKTFARPAYEEIVGIGKAFQDSKNPSSILVRVSLLSSNPEISSKGVKVSSNVGKGGTFSKSGEDSGGVGYILYR